MKSTEHAEYIEYNVEGNRIHGSGPNSYWEFEYNSEFSILTFIDINSDYKLFFEQNINGTSWKIFEWCFGKYFLKENGDCCKSLYDAMKSAREKYLELISKKCNEISSDVDSLSDFLKFTGYKKKNPKYFISLVGEEGSSLGLSLGDNNGNAFESMESAYSFLKEAHKNGELILEETEKNIPHGLCCEDFVTLNGIKYQVFIEELLNLKDKESWNSRKYGK